MNLFAALNSDGYKLGHADMYADGTTKVYSNLTPRTDKIYARTCTRFYDGKLVFFGGQAAIHEIVEMWDKFFAMPKERAIKKYKNRVDNYLGEGAIKVKRMEALHDLGYLPLEIKTLDEGIKVNMGIPVLTITNTQDEFFWLVNYLETVLSNLTWKQATNATIAAEYKAILKHYAALTGTDDFTVSIQAHDFSCRGMSGPEDAARAGMAHLTQFIGTDTLSAMDAIEDYYGCEGLLAISVPATEHAVSSNNILSIEQKLKADGYPYPGMMQAMEVRLFAEMCFMEDLITRKYPTGIVSYVADTYDFWSVLTKVLPALKDVIMARKDSAVAPGKLVIRPDSGDPVTVICGMKPVCGEDGKAIDFESEDAAYEWLDVADRIRDMKDKDCIKIAGVFYEFEANVYDDYTEGCGIDMDVVFPYEVVAGAIRTLWKTFGGTLTSTGHKLLDSHIGLIYGDSITTKRAEEILRRLEEQGYASGNVVFGVGSYTYQCNTRDTFGFAVKATYSVVDGKSVDIFKDPKTDSKKKSAKGLLHVLKSTVEGDDTLFLMDGCSAEYEAREDNLLKLRFKDGVFFNTTTLDEIRARLA